jgi:hypothetical protein
MDASRVDTMAIEPGLIVGKVRADRTHQHGLET